MNTSNEDVGSAIAVLKNAVGADRVLTDLHTRELCSADAFSAGALCAAVVRPATKAQTATVVRIATEANLAVVGRGAGLTYTGAYNQDESNAIVIDTSDLRALTVYPEDRVVVAEVGCTWQQIDAELAKYGLRLPCFGTHSGARATVGGGLSVGAMFFGSARYGTVADSVLGLDVALADGSILATGQGAITNAGIPAYRTYGPDLTGPFIHDSGALGIKLSATFRLINRPTHTGYHCFLFPDILSASKAISAVAVSETCEEAFVLDPASTKRGLADIDLRRGVETLAATFRNSSSVSEGIAAAAKMVRAGTGYLEGDAYSLNIVAAARSATALAADLAICRQAAEALGGVEVPDSIPRVGRAIPFRALNIILGTNGERWVAVNGKVPHSEALDLVVAAERILADYAGKMSAVGVNVSRMLTVLSNHSFSYEPVLHWSDEWMPIHRAVAEPKFLSDLTEPPPNPAARALVAEIRSKMVDLFAQNGAASNQIGRTYPYLANLKPGTAAFLASIKRFVDPRRRINPGVMGL